MFQTSSLHAPAWTREFHRQPKLSATIRRTNSGVRIKFSDGRLAWLDRAGQADGDFMDEVARWAREHGAEAIRNEHD